MPHDPSERDVHLPISISVDPVEVELAADRLFGAGASAVSESPAPDGTVTLVADPSPEHLDALASEFADRGFGLVEPDRAGNEAWREHATVLRAGEHVVIRPAWMSAPTDVVEGDVEVLIDPGAAFGSGTHETTRLCLAAVEAVVRPDDTVLDVGCGSGVLGIAAVLSGAATVTAIDIDPEAVRVTELMASLNGVGDRLRVSGDGLHDVRGRYDLVLANLLIPVIEDLGASLVDRLAPGGTLVVSGVLLDQRERAVDACAPLVVRDELTDGDWACLVMMADPSARI